MRFLLAVLLIFPFAGNALGGNNAAGKAWLSWDEEGSTKTIPEPASAQFPLYLHLSDAPDIRSLAVELNWAISNTPSCYSLVTSPTGDFCGWSIDTLPGGPFQDDSSFTWTINFAPGSSQSCVVFTYSNAHCRALEPARFWLTSVRTNDGAGDVDDLEIVGQATIAPAPTPSTGQWRFAQAQFAHAFASAIHDPVRDRMLLFGGYRGQVMNDVWEFPLTGRGEWENVPIHGLKPSPRAGAAAVYDSLRDRMVIFGGWNSETDPRATGAPTGPIFDDVWVFSLSDRTWTKLEPTGSPGALAWPNAIYDSNLDRLVVFDEVRTAEGGLANVWALSFSPEPAWTRLETQGGPPKLHGPSAIYDPIRRKMVLYGKVDGGYSELWALALEGAPAWKRLRILQASREGHVAFYDQAGDRMIVYSGGIGDMLSISISGDLHWSPLRTIGSQPEPRVDYAAIWDPLRGSLVVSGGHLTDENRLMDDTWSIDLSGTTWRKQGAPDVGPGPRVGHDGVYDPVGRRMLVLGGQSRDANADLWALSLNHGLRGLQWTKVLALSSPPPTRSDMPMVYDSRRNRLIVLGSLLDNWVLTLNGQPMWRQLAQDSPGPPWTVTCSSAIYDPVRDRVLLFGGGGSDQVWELVLEKERWSRLSTLGPSPGPRQCHSAIYDPIRDRMLVYGGYAGQTESDEVWSLDLSGPPTWTRITVSGNAPPMRVRHEALYDGMRDRMLVLAGSPGGTFGSPGPCSNEVWELVLGGPPHWNRLADSELTPMPVASPSAIYDPLYDRVVMYGGTCAAPTSDLWLLDFRDWPDAAVVAVRTDVGQLEIRWQMIEGQAATVHLFRREASQNWERVAELAPDGQGKMVYTDSDIHPQVIYGYGLSFERGATEPATGLVSVRAPGLPTATLVSRLESTAEPGRVRIFWHSIRAGAEFIVHRRHGAAEWAPVARVTAGDDGRLAFEDRDVMPGERYGYRLELDGSVLDELEIAVPEALRLDLKQVGANPVPRAVTISFALPEAGLTRVSLVDVTGHKRLERDLGLRGPGRTVLTLDESTAIPSGVYWVVLTHGSRKLTAKVCLMR